MGGAQTPALPREGGMQDEPMVLFAVLYSWLSLLHGALGTPWCRHHRGPHTLPSAGGCDIAHHLPWHPAKEVFARSRKDLKPVTLSEGVWLRAVSEFLASSSLADLTTQLAGTWGWQELLSLL